MLPRITEALATTCRSASIVPESLLANGSGQKFIARTTTRLEPISAPRAQKSTN